MKHRCTVTSQDYCNSPPGNQEVELPWGPVESESESEDGFILNTPPHYYDDDEEAIASSPAHEDDDDKDFTFSPASPPPLTQSTEVERTTPTSPTPTLYVFPNSTVVLTPDGGCEYIADKHTITYPKPSTSTANDEDPRKVCYLDMQNNIAALIAEEWRASAPSTIEEVTVDVCRSLAFTILSAPYQDIIMKYVRCAIRRQP